MNTENLTGYQHFLLSKIVSLYKAIEGSGDDYNLAFRFFGELCDREEMATRTGLSRDQLTNYVNCQFDEEASGDVAS